MAEAGLADGFDVTLQAIAAPRDYTQIAEIVARAAQADQHRRHGRAAGDRHLRREHRRRHLRVGLDRARHARRPERLRRRLPLRHRQQREVVRRGLEERGDRRALRRGAGHGSTRRSGHDALPAHPGDHRRGGRQPLHRPAATSSRWSATGCRGHVRLLRPTSTAACAPPASRRSSGDSPSRPSPPLPSEERGGARRGLRPLPLAGGGAAAGRDQRSPSPSDRRGGRG